MYKQVSPPNKKEGACRKRVLKSNAMKYLTWKIKAFLTITVAFQPFSVYSKPHGVVVMVTAHTQFVS